MPTFSTMHFGFGNKFCLHFLNIHTSSKGFKNLLSFNGGIPLKMLTTDMMLEKWKKKKKPLAKDLLWFFPNLIKWWQKGFYGHPTISQPTKKKRTPTDCRCKELMGPKTKSKYFCTLYNLFLRLGDWYLWVWWVSSDRRVGAPHPSKYRQVGNSTNGSRVGLMAQEFTLTPELFEGEMWTSTHVDTFKFWVRPPNGHIMPKKKLNFNSETLI